MFAVEYRRTLASARLPAKVAPPPRPLSPRQRLIHISHEWNLARQTELQVRQARAAAEAAERMAAQVRELARRQLSKPIFLAVEAVPLSSPKDVIAAVVAWHPDVTVEMVRGRNRTHPVIAARFDAVAAVYLNCQIDGRRYSLPELGRAFGRDHTTVLYALRARGVATVGAKTHGE